MTNTIFEDPEWSYLGLKGRDAVRLLDIHWALLGNAVDFADQASKDFVAAEKQPSRLKFAILHLWMSIETLLKCRLLFDGWRELVPARERSAGDDAFKRFVTSDIKTLHFNEIYKKVKDGIRANTYDCEYDLLSLLEIHEESIESLRMLRNQCVHFLPNLPDFPENTVITREWRKQRDEKSRENWESSLAGGWSFLIEVGTLMVRQIESELPGQWYFGSLYEDCWSELKSALLQRSTFVEHRYKEIEERLQDLRAHKVLLLTCFNCEEPTLPLEDGPKTCLFCNHTHWEDTFFEDFWERRTGKTLYDTRGEIPEDHPLDAGICPNCETHGYFMMVDEILPELPDVATICFSCNYHGLKKSAD